MDESPGAHVHDPRVGAEVAGAQVRQGHDLGQLAAWNPAAFGRRRALRRGSDRPGQVRAPPSVAMSMTPTELALRKPT